ncbi:MAG: DUF4864 domain-containing protein [Caldimonas sp.]
MIRAASRLSFLFAAAMFATATLIAPPAHADPVSPRDTKAVRVVVEAQLDAFAADDAKRAFSYAAPALREMFGTPDRFMAMVRGGYPVVYRPATVTFLNPEWVQGQLVQGVHLTDSSGVLWLATYRLERQQDKSWRISGCEVLQSTGRMT